MHQQYPAQSLSKLHRTYAADVRAVLRSQVVVRNEFLHEERETACDGTDGIRKTLVSHGVSWGFDMF